MPKSRIPRTCSVANCGRPYFAKRLCTKHYARVRSHGDPNVNLRTKYPDVERFYQEVVLPYRGDDCLIWPYERDGNGYGRMRLDGKQVFIHRRACRDTYGPPPSDAHVAAHQCGNGHLGCCAPNHVTFCTYKENSLHNVLHGRSSRGSKNPRSKLSEDDVKAILAHKGVTKQLLVAEMFSVTRHTIQHIWHGKTWTHLKGPDDQNPGPCS